MPPNFEPPTSPSPPPQTPGRPDLPPPVPNPLRQAHSMPASEQHVVDVNNLPKNANNNLFQSDKPSLASSSPAYDFILNSEQVKPSRKINLPQTKLTRIVIGLAAALVLIIMFGIISSLLKSPSNLPYISSVLEDQQELIHVSSVAANESDINNVNQNFASTATVALSSNATQLQSYLKANGQVLSSKVLNAKVSSLTDQRLTSAESSGDFNSTFNEIASSQLNTYLADLRLAYSKTTGPHGRALLTSFYNQANLLLKSLSSNS